MDERRPIDSAVMAPAGRSLPRATGRGVYCIVRPDGRYYGRQQLHSKLNRLLVPSHVVLFVVSTMYAPPVTNFPHQGSLSRKRFDCLNRLSVRAALRWNV